MAKTVAQLRDELAQALRREEARRLAQAIDSTMARSRHGFMAYATMKKHVASLWGTVDGKGMRAEVEAILHGGWE